MSFTGARLSFMMTEGRPAQKPKSELRQWRAWLAVFGGALVHLTLGTVYTFGKLISRLVWILCYLSTIIILVHVIG